MPKPTLEFTPVTSFPQQPLNPTGVARTDGTMTRVLAKDEVTGDCTQILYHAPGARWGDEGGVRHEHWEEVLILSGQLRDVSLQQWFGEQQFCCRPPGMVHGPWEADPITGCVEIVWSRYESKRRLEAMARPHVIT